MAAPAASVKRPIGQQDIEALAAQVSDSTPLHRAALWLDLPADPPGDNRVHFGVCYVLMVRAGGFMLLAPDLQVEIGRAHV